MANQGDQYHEALSGLINIYPDLQQQLISLAETNERHLEDKVGLRRQLGAERKQNAELRKEITHLKEQAKKDISGRDKKISSLLDELGRGPKSGREASPDDVVTPRSARRNNRPKKTIDRDRISKATDEAFKTFFGKDYERVGFDNK